MGLDCFWVQKTVTENNEVKTEKASIDADIHVAGGLFSGNGNDSFRGKVYDGIVNKASNISLYQEMIENKDILKIADSLDNFDLSNYDPESDCSYGFEIGEDDFEELKKMFRLHADAGHCLQGWW